MQTHAPTTGRLIGLIGFTLTSIVVAIIVYTTFGGTLPLTAKPYEFALQLPDAGNLVTGSDVQISGVKIGEVQSVTRVGSTARVTLAIDPQYAPIRSGASAIMRTKTLLGEAYVGLAPGPRDAPPIPDGGLLAPSHVRPTVSLDQFLSGFNPQALHTFRSFFAGFTRALHGRAGAFNEATARSAPFTANLTDVVQTLSDESPQLQTLVSSTGQVIGALGARVGDLQAAVRAGDAVLTTTGQRSADVQALLVSLPPFLHEVTATSDALTAHSGDFNRAMAALVPPVRRFTPTLLDVRRDVPALHTLFDLLPAATRAGERGLPALSAILRAVTPAFAQLYPASRQLIPVVQLLGAYSEEGVVGPLANGASAQNGTEVGPGGKIIVRPGNSLYLSNESIAGYVKRLPTNRSNPYPTPTGTAELGQIGFLKSYDCRNIHNPLLIPPIGSGVPPCVTQGPWDYDGTTAYYPRLQPAGP
jgi:phospholipid/cholesterol/gamma-HCH transport system substrate-binding protein